MQRKRPSSLLRDNDADGLQAGRLLIEIVENQIRDDTPPETRATLERLIAAGESREDALHLIACVLSAEMFEMLEEKRVFDAVRYARHLHALPALPYDEDEL